MIGILNTPTALLAQTTAPAPPQSDNVRLGFAILLLIAVLIAAVAYLLGARRANRRGVCKTCGGETVGRFCAKCGTRVE